MNMGIAGKKKGIFHKSLGKSGTSVEEYDFTTN
jgi:hypothetical protein